MLHNDVRHEPHPLPPPPKYPSVIGPLRQVLFGRPLPSSRAGEETLPKYLALPILSSNALSSVAYATEAILGILILQGTGALHFSVPISIGICALLLVVTLSYIQIIYAYPKGGGAYPVSHENLSITASLVAGASLMVDYILTVAVSVAAGVAAIISVKPDLQSHIVLMCLASVAILTFANLRGVRESGKVFALPTYIFIAAILATIVAGLIELWTGAPIAKVAAPASGPQFGLQAIGWYLLLQAFSQGCAALTGLEAVSNTVPIFQEPRAKNAAITMIWMGVLAVVMFFGLTYLTNEFHIAPRDETAPGYRTVVSMVADRAWPHAYYLHLIMFNMVQWSTAIVLLLAANTAFAGFPQLASMMARDRVLPRQLANLGDRLAFSNGIGLLALIACILIWIFKGRVNALLPMYAIGVFIGFTLAQVGMVVRWLRLRTKGWRTSLFFNALGAVATGIVSVIIGVSKFDNGDVISPHFVIGLQRIVVVDRHLGLGKWIVGPFRPHYGTWIVLVIIPILVMAFRKIYAHYKELDAELTLDRGLPPAPKHHTVLVLVPRVHRGITEALNYARLASNDVRAVSIEISSENTPKLKADWERYAPDIPLVIIESPSRSLIGPLLQYIDAVQKEREDDIVTVVIPELVSKKLWHRLLHNQHGPLLRFYLFNRPDVIVTNVRYFPEH